MSLRTRPWLLAILMFSLALLACSSLTEPGSEPAAAKPEPAATKAMPILKRAE